MWYDEVKISGSSLSQSEIVKRGYLNPSLNGNRLPKLYWAFSDAALTALSDNTDCSVRLMFSRPNTKIEILNNWGDWIVTTVALIFSIHKRGKYESLAPMVHTKKWWNLNSRVWLMTQIGTKYGARLYFEDERTNCDRFPSNITVDERVSC